MTVVPRPTSVRQLLGLAALVMIVSSAASGSLASVVHEDFLEYGPALTDGREHPTANAHEVCDRREPPYGSPGDSYWDSICLHLRRQFDSLPGGELIQDSGHYGANALAFDWVDGEYERVVINLYEEGFGTGAMAFCVGQVRWVASPYEQQGAFRFCEGRTVHHRCGSNAVITDMDTRASHPDDHLIVQPVTRPNLALDDLEICSSFEGWFGVWARDDDGTAPGPDWTYDGGTPGGGGGGGGGGGYP